jgi:hypothetical protein
MQTWQPIETAPTGVTCLFWIEWGEMPAIGKWDGRTFHACTEHYRVFCGPWCAGGSVETDGSAKATHWMPLPPPPGADA